MMAKAAGLPAKWDQKMPEQATKLCLLGATDEDLAKFFEIAETTYYRWLREIPEFKEAILAGREQADAKVAACLYKRATGYDHEEMHVSNYQGAITVTPIVKHYAPEVVAQIFWLKNRRPDLWRDRHELTGKGGAPIDVSNNELARWMAFVLQQDIREKEVGRLTVSDNSAAA